MLPIVPQEKYAIDDIIVLTPSPEVGTVIKRVAGLPGDMLEVRDGALYRNGERPMRSLEMWRKIRIPVYLDDFRPGNISRWVKIFDNKKRSSSENHLSTVIPIKNGWRFDAKNPEGIMYAHKTGRFIMTETGETVCKMFPGPITNFRAENGTEYRADSLFPIKELQCTFNIKFSTNSAFCAVSLPTQNGEFLFLLLPKMSGNPAEMLRQIVARREIQVLMDGEFFGGIYPISVSTSKIKEMSETPEITVSTLDGIPRVACDGIEISAVEIFDLNPFCSEKKLPLKMELKTESEMEAETFSETVPNFKYLSTARVWCWGDLVEIYHLSLFRGEYWGNFLTNFHYFSQNTKKTFAINCKSCYYVIGDNFFVSQDSRQLGTISPEKIHGKVILPETPTRNFCR
ncbi:MAG: S26 family signal peptidase [Planctomycetia bacterium]|nr:S26 family signal peptidase [Planctomycetia bacterium]